MFTTKKESYSTLYVYMYSVRNINFKVIFSPKVNFFFLNVYFVSIRPYIFLFQGMFTLKFSMCLLNQ